MCSINLWGYEYGDYRIAAQHMRSYVGRAFNQLRVERRFDPGEIYIFCFRVKFFYCNRCCICFAYCCFVSNCLCFVQYTIRYTNRYIHTRFKKKLKNWQETEFFHHFGAIPKMKKKVRRMKSRTRGGTKRIGRAAVRTKLDAVVWLTYG